MSRARLYAIIMALPMVSNRMGAILQYLPYIARQANIYRVYQTVLNPSLECPSEIVNKNKPRPIRVRS